MKKTIILVLTAVFAMTAFAGCSGSEQSFAQKSYEAEGTKIKEINIDVRDRTIDVSISKDNKIHIGYSESEKEYYNISVSDDNILTMISADNKEWTDYIGGKPASGNRKLFLQIPDFLLTSLKLSTTNEDVRISELNVLKDIFISANGGNISFDKLNAGNSLVIKSKNGDVKGAVAGSYDDYSVKCEIKKGESNLPAEKADGGKILNVSNNNGDIDIKFVK